MALTRFGISLDEDLLGRFDRLIAARGWENRSEAIRDLIRDALVREEWEGGREETAGTITLVYSHDTRELTETLNDIQHHYHSSIVSTMHIHLDAHRCLEVVVVKGRAKDIRVIADRLRGTKGVIHGGLSMTTTGKHIK